MIVSHEMGRMHGEGGGGTSFAWREWKKPWKTSIKIARPPGKEHKTPQIQNMSAFTQPQHLVKW
jgi:hypothetical protein